MEKEITECLFSINERLTAKLHQPNIHGPI